MNIPLESTFIGFYKNTEYLPNSFDEFNSKYKLRKLFLNLSNNILGSFCFFSKYEQKFLSNIPLNKVFSYKIKSMLPISFVRKNKLISSKRFNVCINSTRIINNYFDYKVSLDGFVIQNDLIPVAKLISTCFIQNSFQLLINKNLLFHEYVLRKIRKLHGNSRVIDLGDSICLKKDSVMIKIYTSWKHIETKNPNIGKELESAIECIKKDEYYQIYLAYPKNENFTKHILVNVKDLKHKEYRIKAVPYSFRSILQN